MKRIGQSNIVKMFVGGGQIECMSRAKKNQGFFSFLFLFMSSVLYKDAVDVGEPVMILPKLKG